MARERAAVVFAAVAFLFFHFQLAESIAEAFGAYSDLAAFVVWLVLLAAVVALAAILSRHPIAWNYAAVAGALLVALPVVQYVAFRATTEDVDLGADAPELQASAAPGGAPDVYFFLLDGYGRADQLEKTVGYDDDSFLRTLRRRGFTVHDDATAAYPVTFLSLASTLSMGYPAQPGELADHTPFFDAIGGESPVVDDLHELGYEFAFATDYSSFDCGDAVDICIQPSAGEIEGIGGEREAAFLGATPLTTILPRARARGEPAARLPLARRRRRRSRRASAPTRRCSPTRTCSPPTRPTATSRAASCATT